MGGCLSAINHTFAHYLHNKRVKPINGRRPQSNWLRRVLRCRSEIPICRVHLELTVDGFAHTLSGADAELSSAQVNQTAIVLALSSKVLYY